MFVIDLFSGLGGFSQAFLDRGHEVIRYDNNKRFKDVPNTVIKDILELTAKDLRNAKIVLASPPCTCFSRASQSFYWPKLGIPRIETLHAIEMVVHTLRIIKEADPEYWILENPAGRLRDVIGKPDMITHWISWGGPTKKPTHLWGKLPPIDLRSVITKQKKSWERTARDPAKRALIPYDFSMAACLAAEGKSPQKTITDFQ